MDQKDIEERQKELQEDTLKHNLIESRLRGEVYNRLNSMYGNKNLQSKLSTQNLYDPTDLALQARMRQIMQYQMQEFPTAHNSTFGGSARRNKKGGTATRRKRDEDEQAQNFQLEGYDEYEDIPNDIQLRQFTASGGKSKGKKHKSSSGMPKEATLDELLAFLHGSGSDGKIKESSCSASGGKGRKKKKDSKKKAAGKKAAKKNPWIQHLSKVRKEYPKLSNTEVIKKAKESYNK